MNWNGVNLEEVLQAEKRKRERNSEDTVLSAFRQLLSNEDALDESILNNIFGTGKEVCHLNWKNLDPEKIFHIDQIRKLCTDYRLRFLDSQYFKGEIPYEAIAKIKRIQREEGRELKGFKILAPALMFNLQYQDKDPLLFLQLGKDRYYLVHKWGADLHPLRKLMVLPFRNFKSILISVAALALLVVMAIPDSVYMGPYDQNAGALRVIFFFYLFIAFSGLTLLYGFSRLKNFNSALWNSKYMD